MNNFEKYEYMQNSCRFQRQLMTKAFYVNNLKEILKLEKNCFDVCNSIEMEDEYHFSEDRITTAILQWKWRLDAE